MRKIIATGLAAVTLLGGIGIGSTASAQYRHHYRHGNGGAAVAAGIAGLAVGAAIAGSHPYYGDGYYGRAYGYGYGRRCRAYTVWDPYAYAYVERRRCW
ncbi:MAG TPA: hypothetical protein VIJ94_18925 [Caulobacteraceae bacterium]